MNHAAPLRFLLLAATLTMTEKASQITQNTFPIPNISIAQLLCARKRAN